jgi:hypothetical protein
MTTDENNSVNKEDKKKVVGEIIAKAMVLKDKFMALRGAKPKVFYGAIAGVVLLLIIIMSSGGNPEVISDRVDANLKVGQIYTLDNPNEAGSEAMTSLVKEPCVLQGYDRSQNDDMYVCLAPSGTKVEIVQLVAAYGVANLCAKVKVQTGECKGREGWTLTNNIKN